jgi:hypothetical protein
VDLGLLGCAVFVTGWAVSCILKVPSALVIQAQAVQEDVISGKHLPSSIKLYLRRLVSSATLLWESQIFVWVVAISFDHHLNLACCFWSNDFDCCSSDQAVCQFDNYSYYMACCWWKFCAELFVAVLVVYSRHTVLAKTCLLLHLLISATWHWRVVQILTSLKVKFLYKHALQRDVTGIYWLAAIENLTIFVCNRDLYDVRRVTEHHILRLFAFASLFVRLLRLGLRTYDSPRYRQFAKRLGRLIRHTVQYASDVWENFRFVAVCSLC